MKMNEVFTLPIAQNQSRHFKHVVYSEESDGVVFSCHSDQIAKYACHAINNHDRLTEENAKLRKTLKDLVESASVNEEQLNDMLMCSDYGESKALCDAKKLLNQLEQNNDK